MRAKVQEKRTPMQPIAARLYSALEKQQAAGKSRRRQMKSRIFQLAVPVLLVIAFTPALCRAQAEIDPDHFDSPSYVATAAKKTTSLPNPTQAYASFVLPYDAICAGVKLAPE